MGEMLVPLGGAVKYDRIDSIFAARAAVQTIDYRIQGLETVYTFT